MQLKLKRYGNHWLVSGVLIIGISLRFLYLDADPHYYEWVGYITDEGRWVQHARSLALHGKLFDQNLNAHFFVAPLFQLANYLMFECMGVRLFTSRIFTALCGSGILVLFWGFLRHSVNPQALLLGLILLAFQADLVILSRVAVPEMAAIFFQLLVYFLIVSSNRSAWRIAVAGLCLLVSLGIKATMVLFLPIFSVMIFFMPRQLTDRQRWSDLMLFWAGFTLPILALGAVWFSLLPEHASIFLNNLRPFLIGITYFIRLSSPYMIISFPFEHTLSPTFNLWALGLWLSAVGWMAAGWNNVSFRARRYLVTSVIWFALYLLLMLSLEYFPTRYKVHVLIPMAVCISVGISLLQRVGIQKISETFSKIKGASALVRLGVLSAPTAAFLSPLLDSAVSFVGIDPERLTSKLACFILLLITITHVVNRVKHNQQAIRFILIFPVAGGMAWATVATLASHYSFWPSAASQIASFWLVALLASVVSAAVVWFVGRPETAGGGRFVTVCALFYLAISLAGIAPGYINPHYSVRDASRDLGTLLGTSSTIATLRAESLFNENHLRYRSKVNWHSEKPEILVAAFGLRRLEQVVEREYQPVKTYNLYVAPEYYRSDRNGVSGDDQGVAVTVYKKN